jgi:hypothetical protein
MHHLLLLRLLLSMNLYSLNVRVLLVLLLLLALQLCSILLVISCSQLLCLSMSLKWRHLLLSAGLGWSEWLSMRNTDTVDADTRIRRRVMSSWLWEGLGCSSSTRGPAHWHTRASTSNQTIDMRRWPFDVLVAVRTLLGASVRLITLLALQTLVLSTSQKCETDSTMIA